MTSEELIKGLKKGTIDLGIESDLELFNEGIEQESNRFKLDPGIHDAKINGSCDSDEYRSEAKNLFNNLSEDHRRVFFDILRRVRIDSLAGVLSVLDGKSWLEKQEDDFELTCVDNPDIILNGELTDMFLNEVYEWDR